ncbi:MAG: AIR synthase-related protein, partial [Bacteroides xylanisolvens]
MVSFFQTLSKSIIAVQTSSTLNNDFIQRLTWAFSGATVLDSDKVSGFFVGPRREMITPWSTNAVEITQNMGIDGIVRIEEFFPVNDSNANHDPMLQRIYDGLNQEVFTINRKPEPIIEIDDIEAYNLKEGLALSSDEIEYLNSVSQRLGRKLTDSEVFGFSQVNSEHCRHKIFNGTFIIDGEEKESSLFKLIKKTSQTNPNNLVSAYKDNVAFNKGPEIEQFAPTDGDKPSYFEVKPIKSVISLKAETHNFPTTVEPFNGAATGSGGEIRDRLGGGKASLPIAGTAVYMTAYPRTKAGNLWEETMPARPWLYQTPEEILIKASNGASDFGNKYGQPLICGSLLTFEHQENQKKFAYDKVIMLAGGVGYGNKRDALKGEPKPGEKVVILGGDNYRIGMGGGAVSSVDTGQFSSGIELNAVQRANPEMQKRAANVIRALAESDNNPIVSIHDHGAGGHLNCLSELVEATGGKIDISKLPIGDPTLSSKEIVGNESQERMGLLIPAEATEYIKRIADRERSPMYVVGETT